jgi:ABC-type nitrate/sulfonate/bicarbonate transport system substrate-binding protein
MAGRELAKPLATRYNGGMIVTTLPRTPDLRATVPAPARAPLEEDLMRIAAFVLTATALLLTACAPGVPPAEQSPGAPAGAAVAASDGQPVAQAPATPREPVKLIQALPNREIGSLPPLVAAGKGFFAEEGLEVELPVMTSNAAIPALTNKQIHLAAGGSGARAAYQGAPLRAIFYGFKQVTLIPVGSPEVKSYKDLAGKVFAVSSPGGSDDWLTKWIIQREGISLADARILPIGPPQQRTQAMVAGQVQFSALPPDIAVDLERKGYHILGNLGELMPIPWGGFAAHVDMIREQPDVLKAWLRANVRALQFIKRSPAEAAAIVVREFGLDAATTPRAVELVLPAISDDDPGGFTEASLLLNTQFDLEVVEVAGDPLEIGLRAHDLTLLRQVQRELGIACKGGYGCP